MDPVLGQIGVVNPRRGATRLCTASPIWGWICLAGLGMTGLGYFGMFHAAEFVAPGPATVIANTQPIIAGILAYVLLGERLAARGRLGMLIGLEALSLYLVFVNMFMFLLRLMGNQR